MNINESDVIKNVKQLASEAESFLEKGQTINASEKLYEAGSKLIILLAKKYVDEAKDLGEELSDEQLVANIVNKLSEIFGIEGMHVRAIADYVCSLYDQNGEIRNLSTDELRGRISDIRKLMELIEKF